MGIALPRWVWIGTCALAATAGMINAVGYLGYEHQAVTHLTGTTTLLGMAIGQGRTAMALELAALALAFLGGATLSGLIIQNGTLKLGRRYGLALAIESAMLAAAVPMLERQWLAGIFLAAAACGLQNGMVTTYSGAIIRTTHVTGLFTDLGLALGHWIRGLPVGTRRASLCLLIILSFLAGGIVGVWLFQAYSYRALYVPAVLTGSAGFSYAAYRQLQLQRQR
ncbi:YoaK family protein [Pseudomonas sp. CGJS7]|uniref:YoaK family protein n=1 Tax=Pseudomonas sp. CGJS7 TaxID=3109348 RepID=UPI0030081BE6